MSKVHRSSKGRIEWVNFVGLADEMAEEAIAKKFGNLQRMSPADKLIMAFELSDRMREAVRGEVRHRYPDWNEAQVNAEVLRIYWGDRLYNEVLASGQVFK